MCNVVRQKLILMYNYTKCTFTCKFYFGTRRGKIQSSDMCSKLIFLFSCIIVGAASMRIVRDAPKNAEIPSFSEFFENAGKNLKELENVVLKSLGVENTQQLEEKAINEGKQIASKLDQWAKDIKVETENLKDNAAVKDLRESVDKAIEEFKLKHPDTTSDIKNYVEKANEGSEQILAKLKALSESDDAKNIKDLSQKLLDAAATTFKNISTQIQEKH